MGKQLVADVILNRVDSPDFTNDIVSVITQKTGDVYQFSSYSDGHMAAVWEPSEETYEAVRMELAYRSNPDVLYFTEGRYNPYCEPGFIHGAHYFGY
jgi:spore germination cell wall hydrolase CwlJ-like protein